MIAARSVARCSPLSATAAATAAQSILRPPTDAAHINHISALYSTTSSLRGPKFQDPRILSKEVTDYVMKVGFKETALAKELRLITGNHPHSGMMGDPAAAAMFKVLLPAINAKKIIEVGVFTGYSTLVMAESIDDDAKIIALDINDDFVAIGRTFWERARVQHKIDLRLSPAAESLQKLLDEGDQEGTFDFAFIDADKTSYMVYYELLLKLIRKNGIIAVDNVLWGGEVLNDEKHPDAEVEAATQSIRDLTKHIYDDDRVEFVLLPFADGVTVVRKK